MKQISKQLSDLIAGVRPQLDAISETRAAEKPVAQKWSPKEILGHLIDSAANNHFNKHLAHVVAGIDPASLTATCDVGDPQPATLELIVRDYVRHVRHHLDQILGGDDPLHRKQWE
jgi:hypothetical protein